MKSGLPASWPVWFFVAQPVANRVCRNVAPTAIRGQWLGSPQRAQD